MMRHRVVGLLVVVGLSSLGGAAAQAQSPPPDSNFQKVVLDAAVNQPTELAVAADGRVFFLDRTGRVRVWRPASQTTTTALTLSVDITGNHGLLALTLDPGFATNHFVYLYYSPVTPSVTRLSRFTAIGDTLDVTSERVMLEIPTQRICCHEGASLTFGPDGSLYLSTGDNTDPFESNGAAPIDERPGRETFDSQRSTANTQDLRGKILRIVPQPDGTYTIPSGNLFTSPSAGRPEIYTMGLRNPFRISVDPATNWLYWGEVGPDATNDSATQGPKGYDEFNQAKSAGNYGWPYCIADNKPYLDYNFATGVTGPAFNCAAPVNNSPNNTGALNLPAARPAWIWYPYGASAEFPQMGNQSSRAAMAGPVYHFDAALVSSTKIPSYFDGRLFIFDWARDWVQTVKMDGSGNITLIERFLPSFTFSNPIDLTFGPDGALYVLEWGAGVGHESGPDAKLSRIEWKGTGGGSPLAVCKATPDNGVNPLAVAFSSAGSADPEGGALTYAWDFTTDGSTDSTAANPSFTYATSGNYTAKLTVTDPEGKTGVAAVPVTVGNTRPVVTMTEPPNGGFVQWQEQVSYIASVTDAQDGSTPTGITCGSVQIVPGIGHDDHTHSDPSVWACQGALLLPPLPADHAFGNTTYVVEAVYTDRGAGSIDKLTGKAQVILQPKRKQAEFWSQMNGVQTQTTGDTAGGGLNLSSINDGDWVSYTPMNLRNITSVSYRAASAGLGGRVEVHVDSPTGTLISNVTIPVNGNWQVYSNISGSITDPGGTHELFFVFRGGTGSSGLFNINWIDFNGAGVSTKAPYNDVTGTVYEAENAVLSGVTVATNQAGYTGTGFADYDGNVGSYVEWTVNAPAAGSYALEFRYANGGTTNRPMNISVGGVVVASNVPFAPTGAWTAWAPVRVTATLAAGNNVVRATAASAGGPNVDSLALPAYQAENAALSSVIIEGQYSGYSGTAYANYTPTAGAYIEWTVNAPSAGSYTLDFRYALGAASARNLEIKVGNTIVASALSFAPTGAWTTWASKTLTATLAAGANKIRATATADGPNVDALIRR